MSYLDAILLGLVEGVTEFLPVSSTGHLILASSLLGLEQTAFVKSFEIAIQFGAILSVVALYWRSFLDFETQKRLAIAFLPTAIIGLSLYPFIKSALIGNEVVVVWALALGGIALIVFEFLHIENPTASRGIAAISYAQAVAIGLCQSIAIIPGVSRSGATIVGGLLVGLPRITVVEFSFLLAVPTMLAATGLDLLKTSTVFTRDEWLTLGVGFVVSFGVALISIVWLLRFVRSHTFIPFGVYRVVLAILFGLLFLS